MEEIKNILYPIALTDISKGVVPFVVTLAKQLDAKVHLIHVLRRFDWFVDTYVSEPDPTKPDFKRIASDLRGRCLNRPGKSWNLLSKPILRMSRLWMQRLYPEPITNEF
jgi:nucleotide-binding universal stress UspA family protein